MTTLDSYIEEQLKDPEFAKEWAEEETAYRQRLLAAQQLAQSQTTQEASQQNVH